jgi:hypothetical protein
MPRYPQYLVAKAAGVRSASKHTSLNASASWAFVFPSAEPYLLLLLLDEAEVHMPNDVYKRPLFMIDQPLPTFDTCSCKKVKNRIKERLGFCGHATNSCMVPSQSLFRA